MVAGLARVLGDLDRAEDAVQDALAVALERWPRDGVPANPGAWLTTCARNKAIDALRRERNLAAKREALLHLAAFDAPGPESAYDAELALLFTCCHPALALESQVGLTLRLVGGLTTEEIARAFLVPEPTMAARITRAKKKIREARIPLRVPDDALLPARLPGVLAVIYLVYNTGYSEPRLDLAAEAVRLGRLLVALMPDEPEARGLLALLLLQHSRRRARFSPSGSLVLLADQDQSLWDHGLIAEGRTLLDPDRPGRYQLQAAIAAVHCSPVPDWAEIVALYSSLRVLDPSPVVALNRAVAVAEVDGVAAGLEIVSSVAETLDGYHLLHSTRAELLRRLGDVAGARVAYQRALDLAPTQAERIFLSVRFESLGGPPG